MAFEPGGAVRCYGVGPLHPGPRQCISSAVAQCAAIEIGYFTHLAGRTPARRRFARTSCLGRGPPRPTWDFADENNAKDGSALLIYCHLLSFRVEMPAREGVQQNNEEGWKG